MNLFLKTFRFECNKLRVLDVGHNQLTDVPREIKKLIALKELYINNNNLTDLPKVIEECMGNSPPHTHTHIIYEMFINFLQYTNSASNIRPKFQSIRIFTRMLSIFQPPDKINSTYK